MEEVMVGRYCMSKPLMSQSSLVVMGATCECLLHPRHLSTQLSVLGTCIYFQRLTQQPLSSHGFYFETD